MIRALALAVSFLISLPAARTRGDDRTPDRIENLARYLGQALPGPSAGRVRRLEFTTELHSQNGSLCCFEWKLLEGIQRGPYSEVLRGYTQYGLDGRPTIMTFLGGLVNEAERRSLRARAIREAPATKFSKVGNRRPSFGSSSEAEVRNHMAGLLPYLETLLGKGLELRRLTFEAEMQKAGDPESYLCWKALYHSPTENGAAHELGESVLSGLTEVVVEPFDGRIVRVLSY